MKCETVGCKHTATRRMSWRDPYAERSSAEHPSDAYYPELDLVENDRVTDAVCDPCLTSYQHRPALQARDEGPVDLGAEARRLIGERE